MSRIRHFTATFALVAMSLSLAEGLLATAACAGNGDMPEMAMHEAAASAPGPASGSAPTAPHSDQDGPRCPMNGAVMSACSGSAIVAAASFGVEAVPLNRVRAASQPTHVPVSFVALGLFRPPIA